MSIILPKDLEEILRARSASEAEIEAFLRAAVTEKLRAEPAPVEPPAEPLGPYSRAYEMGKHLFGKYDLGREDLAENSETILRDRLDAKHRR